MIMKIQRMNIKHLNSVVEIENTVYRQPWTHKQFENSISHHRSKTYVAVDNDTVCGYLILFRHDDNWYIENLTIAEEHRRKNIGTKLICMSKKLTHPEHILVLVQDVFLPMHLLLKKNGFIATHIERDKDGDEYYAFTTN